MYNKIKILGLTLALWATTAAAQSKVNDYLRIPGPIQLNNTSYNLVWTSHPNNNYYKQEYLTAGDNLEKFKSLVTVDFLQGNFQPRDLASQKVEELKKLKATNPMINYNVYEKNQEYILDFLISQASADGKGIAIIERNVYRYHAVGNNGVKGLLLFAASQRAYGAEVTAFLKKLSAEKSKLVDAVAAYKLPEVSIK
ncbi:hypothetical protein FHW36_106193 [Chitinophaga polysaccharea]|uniref:Uncharacterized protein n=1 Tax=Chitinophaga polysaccharea TaxID=1293035 RepID=A0A561PLK4_9BACT|nr:hypothetical protein [Chitinophaga polysaccharea]TWF38970.1 hypothetical protein FHW36_106193 [Chitinophaga polysaccharea]